MQQVDSDGNLVLHCACEHKQPNPEVIKLVMEAYPLGLQKKDKDGNLPLHSALEVGDVMPADIIEEMLKLYPGACLVADRDHNYPVHCCFHECKESLEKKAMMVIDAGPKALAEKSRKLKQYLLFHAVQSRRYSDQLVAKLANAYPKGCEVKDAEGNIPLHLELERGDGAKMEVVKILVEASPSSVKIKDKDKNTPLHSAVESIHDLSLIHI